MGRVHGWLGSSRALSWALPLGLGLVTDSPGHLPASRVSDSDQERFERPRRLELRCPQRPRTAATETPGSSPGLAPRPPGATASERVLSRPHVIAAHPELFLNTQQTA